MSGPYSIGGSPWPGLSKLIEEAGEVIQVAGKILGTGGEVQHWDGSDLRRRLLEEMADVTAAIQFMISENDFDVDFFAHRVARKLETFQRWSAAGDPVPKTSDEALAMRIEERQKGHHSGSCPYPMTNCTCGAKSS